jgi:hypothetical protein
MRITGTLQSRRSSVTRLIGSVLGSLLVVLAFTGAAAAPADNGGRPTVARAAPPVLEVVAMDYAFRLPDTVRAGVTTVRLINRGQHMHHIQLVRLDGGHTIADLLRAWKPGVPTPRWMTGVGGPTAPVGGQTLDALVVLRPGRYGVLCWVPAADGQLHFQKGMFGQFEVAAPSGGAGRGATRDGAPAGRRDHHDGRLRVRHAGHRPRTSHGARVQRRTPVA